MVLNKKVLRTMLEHKSRYIGAFILVFLSSMLYVAFSIAAPSALDSIDAFRDDNKVEDAYFIMQKPLEDIEGLEKEFSAVIEERQSVDYEFDKASTLRIFRETEKLDKYAASKGERISSDNEILIDEKFADAHEIEIGEKIKIAGKNFKLTGFMVAPDYIYPLKTESDLLQNPETFGIAVVSKESFNDLEKSINFYSIKFNKDNVQEFKDSLNTNNIIIKWMSSEDNPRISAIDGDVGGFFNAGRAIPIFIMILTCLLIAIVLWRLLKSEFVQIGTLYALGYRKLEILKHYLSYSAILSLSGSILGAIPGFYLVKALYMSIYVQYNFPEITPRYDLVSIIVGVLLPSVFLIPTTVLVVMKALRMPPLELIRGGGNKTRVGFLEKKFKLNRFKFDTKFKIRELVRNIPRALLLTIGVAFASMLLLFGFSTFDSINGIIDDSYNNVYKYNYFYRFNSLQTEKPVSGEITSVIPFETVKNGGKVSFKLQGMQRDAELIKLKDNKNEDLSFDTIIITRPLADKLKLTEGDSLDVKNKIDSKKAVIKVEKIAETYIGDYVFMPIDSFNSAFGYPKEGYSGLLTDSEAEVDSGKLISTIKMSDITDGYNNMVKPLKYMLGVIAAFAVIIGLIIIYVVTSLIIEENRANISLLKVLGYGKKHIYSLILNSSNLLVLIGYIAAIPLIVSATGTLLSEITSNMDITIPVKLEWFSILIGFVIIWVAYILAKIASRSKIIKISMADSLKSRVE